MSSGAAASFLPPGQQSDATAGPGIIASQVLASLHHATPHCDVTQPLGLSPAVLQSPGAGPDGDEIILVLQEMQGMVLGAARTGPEVSWCHTQRDLL